MGEVELRGVTKQFPDGTVAVDDLDLTIADGELVVLVGPSGCGKSTSLRMVAGLEEVTDGEILIDGKVVNALSPRERDIAMVFQTYALYPHMTVAENMAFPLRMAKASAQEKTERVRAAAEILDITELLERHPRALSGGQRQRVAMGRAIVRNPRAFLMDEPLSNLDAKLRVQMRAEISRLQEELRATMMYVTHDQVEAMTMGDRVAVMRNGVLQQLAPPRMLYESPANVFVAGFIGSPPMTLCKARIEGDDDGLAVTFGTNRLTIDPRCLASFPRLPQFIDREVVLGMRPARFHIPDAAVPDGKRIRAEVDLVEILGADALVYLGVDAQPLDKEVLADVYEEPEDVPDRDDAGMNLVASIDARVAPERGEVIDVAYETDALHFFDPHTGDALT
jgi:multiple sugar transport system ATP-binding protein